MRKRSGVFDRFSFARTTSRRIEELMEAWILCTLHTHWTLFNVALIQSFLFICIIDFTIREEISAKDILISRRMNMITIF